MAKGIVTIAGDTGFDGTYEILYDERALTNYEYHVIKKISGVRAGEFEEAAKALDLDVIVALAVIALIRDGKVDKTRWKEASAVLMEAEGGDVVYFEPPEDDDASPPAETPPSDKPSSSGEGATTAPSSNDSESTSDDPPETTPTPTGTPV